MKKAIIAMSGGVDSSVAAYLMINAGYDCIGATMKLYNNDEVGIPREKACCTADDIMDAKIVSTKLKMSHYTYNFQGEFEEKVIKNFVETYEKGATPNPCIECNRYLKFEKLYQRMIELNYDYIVTGHYAIIEEKENRFFLKKAKDTKKDQTYVLYSLTQEQLSHVKFPLGDMTKSEIRQIAEENGLITAHKKESMDICFVPDGDYAKFIENYTQKTYQKGNFVDKNGNILGTHNGVIRYTIGQRKGLGVATGFPIYVIDKDLEKNNIILGSNDDLNSKAVIANNFNWIIDEPKGEIKCKAKTRYNMKEQPCVAFVDGDNVKVVFDDSVRAATTGQAVVLYDEDFVLGGGTIIDVTNC